MTFPNSKPPYRLEIYTKIFDTRAEVKKRKLQAINPKIEQITLADVYTINKPFTKEELEKIASRLANPITQNFTIHLFEPEHQTRKPTPPPVKNFFFTIEIGFLPGVTDNVAGTAQESIEDLLKTKFKEDEAVYTSLVIFIEGKLSMQEVQEIADSLYNPLIQRMHIKTYEQFAKDGGMDIVVPKVQLQKKPQVTEIDLDVSDEVLVKIGKAGIPNPDGTTRGPLALDITYMKTIQKYFKQLGRKPNDIELESIAQTWSEHCKHTIFADPIDDIKDGLYKTFIKKATQDIREKKGKKDFCVSVFTDNSGGIIFDHNYLVTHKVETHNSPSALDPFGGAITGIVGVNRDTIGFGMGAKPVANFYGYCFAPPASLAKALRAGDPEKDIPLYIDQKRTQKMLSSRRIMDGVIDGVNSGGNQSGIPTPQGFIYFDERYRGKPLVFVGTVGLIPKSIQGKPSHVKKAQAGDYIVMLGGRVGKDGIHGATFSSEALTSGSPATAVQIGDPITQKKLSDAIVKEARDKLLYNSITDNGAGGISCSVAEMAKECGGCVVELEKVPLKYPGLDPWEIWISESQERMTLAVPKNNWNEFADLMERRGVEATVIGEFTGGNKCIVKYNGKTIVDIDMDFLHDGLPERPMKSKKPKSEILNPKSETNTNVQNNNDKNVLNIENSNFEIVSNFDIRASDLNKQNFTKSLLTMLGRLNITSYEFISKQYDHMVQSGLVLPPLQGRGRVNADTSVFRPVLTSSKGVILSQGLYPSYSELDPYAMAASSIDTAIRNAVAAGANPDYLSLLDNFCWPSGNDPERLWQLKLTAKACYDYAVAYETPFISGKDSMFNDFSGFDKDGKPVKISIQPTLLISSFGVIDDVAKVISLDAKNPGDSVYIAGETIDELAGSEYSALQNISGSNVPQVNAEKNKQLYHAFYKAVQQNLIASSISISRGGLAVALARKAIGGMLGLNITLENLPGDARQNEAALYSESQGRILVTVTDQKKKEFEKIMKGLPFAEIGKVTKDAEIIVKGLDGKEIINLNLDKAVKSYRETFSNF